MIRDIRRRAGETFLRRSPDQPGRRKAVVNLNKANSVGILFELVDEKVYHAVHDYANQLRENKIQVKVIGYTQEERLMKQFLPILSFDIIGNKSLNWYFKPTANCVGDFILNPFDICINIASPRALPLKFIEAQSSARLKVGPFAENDQGIYDLMIHTDEEHDQEAFLKNVHEYLTILNPKDNA